MNEFRKTLIDRVIKVYGFEHEIVIEFASLCESCPDNEVLDLVLDILAGAYEEHLVLD